MSRTNGWQTCFQKGLIYTCPVCHLWYYNINLWQVYTGCYCWAIYYCQKQPILNWLHISDWQERRKHNSIVQLYYLLVKTQQISVSFTDTQKFTSLQCCKKHWTLITICTTQALKRKSTNGNEEEYIQQIYNIIHQHTNGLKAHLACMCVAKYLCCTSRTDSLNLRQQTGWNKLGSCLPPQTVLHTLYRSVFVYTPPSEVRTHTP